MSKLSNFFLNSCSKSTFLVEKKLDSGLSALESMQLFFHLKICDGCRNYQHHSEKIHKALQTYLRKQETPVQNVNVPEDLKKEILDEWERHKKQ